MMKCPRCLNTDQEYFYKGSKGYYCRKCVKFKRILLKEEIEPINYDVLNVSSNYSMKYELTSFQKDASYKVLENLKQGKDVLLHCVCGAGKTELVVDSISAYLRKGLKVCYAISRKEVVIELEQRFKTIFKNANIVSLYGGHTEDRAGDLIICTTHQLFRYYKTFDLLILDEVDAFPLSGNETLMNISLNSCKGNIVYSTATINNFLKKYLKKRKYEEVKLYIRPNLKPLTIPRVFYNLNFINYLSIIFMLRKIKGQCIIFISSKELTMKLYRVFKHLINTTYVYSDLDSRNKNILDFKQNKYKYILSTTVLERGITIKNVNVIIIHNRKSAFETSAIVQMCGRVGRGLNSDGKAYILSSVLDRNIFDALRQMKEANEYALSLL